MSILADFRTLWHLAAGPIRRRRGDTHAQRLERFYARQADGYDDFRRRLLPGRAELYRAAADAAFETSAPATPDRPIRWVDFGGGTAENVEHVADRLPRVASLHVVDLAPSLLRVAERRVRDRGWTNVHPVLAEATTFRPPQTPVDVVTFSYALTMIPDFAAAVAHARALLRPGGVIGVVDFYTSGPRPPAHRRRHGVWTRRFWPAWFGLDGVRLCPGPLDALEAAFERVVLSERLTGVPYVPLGRVPYYLFLGRRG